MAAPARAVPPGTAISNTAQAAYRAWGIDRTTSSNTVRLTTTWMRTPSRIELLQYAPGMAAAEQVRVPATDYSMDGTAGGTTQAVSAIHPAGSTGAIDLSQPVPLAIASIYHQGEPLFFRVADADHNIDPLAAETLWILVSSPARSDSELLLLTETGPNTGLFTGCLQTFGLGPGQPFNGVLEVTEGARITAQYTDAADAADSVSTSALVDPFGLVFDSTTGLGVNDVTLTLVQAASGQPAVVYGDDGTSRFPATIVSGGTFTDSSGKTYTFATGSYRFPFVAPGTYRLVVQPPAGYAAPSTVPTATLQHLPGAPFALAEPGSRGEAFVLNPGPALRLDVPVDPINAGLWVRKTANHDIAAVGDFVQYTVTLENSSGLAAGNVVITDRLPLGFRYRQASARLDGQPLADPTVSAEGRTLSFTIGTVADGRSAQVRYVTEIGAGAKTGKARNLAQAASANGLRSNTATVEVTVKEDLFRSKNFLVGRVIADNCADAPTEAADGVPGVRLYLEDGTYVITDAQGMYHFEGVSTGTHVVQLDLASLPAAYAIAACEQNTRAAGTPFSRFVELQGGTLWRQDFHVTSQSAPQDRKEVNTVKSAPPAPAAVETAPVQDFAQVNVDALAPGFGWLMPAADYYPPIPSVKIAIQHGPQESIELRLNGQPVSPFHFDGLRANRTGTTAVSFWRGVDLRDGDNHFTAIRKTAEGREIERSERTVHYSGPPVKAVLVKEASRLIADGKEAPVLAVRLTDRDGRPARFGILGDFSVQAPHAAEAKVDALRDGLAQIERGQPHFSVGGDGIALIRLQPTTQSGHAVVRLHLDGREQEIRAWLQPEAREWILVGLAEGTAGYNSLSGNMEHLNAVDAAEDFYQDGRMAFFAKGKVKGQWLLTAAYDSARDRNDPDNRMFQTIDPESYYTLYGDATQQQYEASSIRKLYLKIERDQFYALFGDYETGLTVTELSRYSRRLNGLKSEYNGDAYGYSLFAADAHQAYVRDEIQGDGTSGLYRLSRRPIMVNSDKIIVEIRDRFRSEVILSSRVMMRFVDYSIDYEAGTLFFKAPIYSRDENFNPIFIVAEYESEDPSEDSYTYGGRGSVKLLENQLEVGATYVHEGPSDAAGELGGLDAQLDLGGGLKIKTEVAGTHREGGGLGAGGQESRGQGYLAEVSKSTENFDGQVYFRELGDSFGLGQQNGSEIETRKTGADAAWRFKPNWTLTGETYRYDNLASDAVRDFGEADLLFSTNNYSLRAGGRMVQDRLADGTDNASDQLLLGLSRTFLDNRLQLRVTRDQSIGGHDESVDFPTRTILGSDYQISKPVSVFAEQEFTQGGREDTQSSRVGFKATPWTGGQLGSSVGQQTHENGERLFANLGLFQTWRITEHWNADGGLDSSRSIRSSDFAPFNVNSPTAAGTTEDFTAVTLGLGYKADFWSWAGRVESRWADTQDKWGLITGIAGEVRKGLGLSAGVKMFTTDALAGADTQEGDVRLSLAWRPTRTDWIIFDRLDYKFDRREDDQEQTDARRIVNNLNLNFRPHHRLQLAMQYGAKYVFDTIDHRSYTGYTDLTGFEARYDLTQRWDIGAQASLLHSWQASQLDYSTGLSVGYTLFKNAWLSLGYNFTGFKDEDFSAGSYTAQGPFAKFRMKFDQQSVRDMVDWFSRK
jgi:uncharacterized repeat protein (TIGR01451 family)